MEKLLKHSQKFTRIDIDKFSILIPKYLNNSFRRVNIIVDFSANIILYLNFETCISKSISLIPTTMAICYNVNRKLKIFNFMFQRRLFRVILTVPHSVDVSAWISNLMVFISLFLFSTKKLLLITMSIKFWYLT